MRTVTDNQELIRRLMTEPDPRHFTSLTRFYQHIIDERVEAAGALNELQGPLPEHLKPTTTVETALVAEVTRLGAELKASREKVGELERYVAQLKADLSHHGIKPSR